MNFDELQKQWDNQIVDNEVLIETDLELKKEANTIIDRVRKVMKKDFYFQLTSFPLLLIYPFLFGINSPLIWWIVSCICASMIVPFYYLIRFYKSSYKLEFNSLKNINWFYYNYKSSITIFSLYTYIISILVILFIGVVLIEKETFNHVYSIQVLLVFLGIALLFQIGFCIWMLKWWIDKFYKKPLIELENILNQLEE